MVQDWPSTQLRVSYWNTVVNLCQKISKKIRMSREFFSVIIIIICFLRLSVETWRLKVAEQLVELHTAGLEHQNIYYENVLDNNGTPFLINFAQAEPHVCRRTMPINKGDIVPEVYDFDCLELYDWVALETKIWFPSKWSLSLRLFCSSVLTEENWILNVCYVIQLCSIFGGPWSTSLESNPRSTLLLLLLTGSVACQLI